MADGVKETICTGCTHLQVCSHKNDMLSAIEAVDNVTVPLGDNKYAMLRDIPWIKPVELKCIYYLRKEAVIR